MLYALSNKLNLLTGTTLMLGLLVHIVFYNTLYLKFRDPHSKLFITCSVLQVD